MSMRKFFCCFFPSNEKPKPKPDAQAALVEAREKLIASKQRIDPAQLTDITPKSSRDVTPRGSVYSPKLIISSDDETPTPSCRCW